MDTFLSSLPPHVGEVLMENFTIVEIIAMFSIGCFNAVEVALSTFETFKRYRGLYFWSIQIASWGILVHAVPAQIRYVSVAPGLPMCIPFIIGWYAMVTGQAVVLYSRLHLVVQDIYHVRWVLAMIITNFFALHVPMTVLFFGLNLGDMRFEKPAQIYDRIQLTGFCIQDFVICGIYIREALRALKPVLEVKGREGRKVIYHLIWVNVIVVVLNITLLLAEHKAHYIEVSYKAVIYSIKLKLEFYVLNRLRELTRISPCMCQRNQANHRPSIDINVFDLVIIHQTPAPDVEATPALARVDLGLPRLRSSPNSTNDFHDALREAASSDETSFSKSSTCVYPPAAVSADHLSGRGSRMKISNNRSTVEMTPVESPKPG
ncbi:uncharacterized protein PFLUO_LOCUS5836 [Penicillium psychrofluorescens]|uniref:uncharacterized protein n=1 Tax=Penicillium psychrofluorescens TaxID=3158075 RepID=UPI003CCD0001